MLASKITSNMATPIINLDDSTHILEQTVNDAEVVHECEEVCLHRENTCSKRHYSWHESPCRQGQKYTMDDPCASEEQSATDSFTHNSSNIPNTTEKHSSITTTTSPMDQFGQVRLLFHRACQQILILERKCAELEHRHQRNTSHKPFQYNVRLQLCVVKEVLDMFKQYAEVKLYHLSELYTIIQGYSLLDTLDYEYMEDGNIDVLPIDSYLQDEQDNIFLDEDDSVRSEIELIGEVDGDESLLVYYV